MKCTRSNCFKLLFFVITLFSQLSLSSQIEGSNLFATDQVVTIALDFPQNDFWQQLEYNYDNIDENGSVYIPANLTLTDATGTYSFDSVGVRLKGNSSGMHPGDKKSFKIDFNKYISGQNYDGLKKLNFSNGFKDPTFMREKLFFDLCRERGVAAPRANYANVVYNGQAWGFYTVIEQIDDQFLDWRIGDDDGNLFKAGSNFGSGDGEASLQYMGPNESSYESSYELKSNEDENDWSDLIEFISFINNSSDADFEIGLPERLDLGPFLSSVAFNILFSNLDTYTLSARNYYLYHNMSTDQWEWIKWDANETFGSYGNGQNMEELDIDFYEGNRPLLERVFENEVFMSQYTSEICLLLNTVFNPNYLNPIIDDYKTLIQDDVYADENKMFSNAAFDTNIETNLGGGGGPGGGGPGGGGPGGGTTYGLKSFIQARYDYLSSVVSCEQYSNIESLASKKVEVYPNPISTSFTIDGLDSYPVPYSIKGLNGVVLKSDVLHHDSQVIDISKLESNLYFLQINGAVFKLIKQ